MRVLFLFVLVMLATCAMAQTEIQNRFPATTNEDAFSHHLLLPDSSRHSKWSFSKYVSLSAGYSFFRGKGASFVAVPAGLQLSRQLTNHVYAFTGVSVAPVYLNVNGAFLPNDFNKTAPGTAFYKPGSVGMFSKAELGLMYTNEARTFSISGSIGVERSRAPIFYPGSNTTTRNPAVPANY